MSGPLPGRNLSSEAATLLRLLEDGTWQNYEQVTSKLAGTVAPGKALRKWNALRESAERRFGPRQSAVPSDDEKIASGQRTYAVAAMNSLKERHLEFRGEGMFREVRRRPVPLVVSKDGEPISICGVPEHHDLDQRIAEAVAAALQNPRGPESEALQTARGTSGVGPELCESCGFYVANWEAHREFHERFDAFVADQPAALPEPREMGLVDENALRVLVRQEVDAALDTFQRGIQNWLLERFAALEEVMDYVIPTRAQRAKINRHQ